MHIKPLTISADMNSDARTETDTAYGTAAALTLMTHYAQQPCPLVAHAITQQLGWLARHGNEGASRNLQSFATMLLSQWQKIACGIPAMIAH